jgi:tetratricopeptide (TPR) repeat protein
MKYYPTMRLALTVILIAGVMVPMLSAQAGRGRGRLKGIVVNEDGGHIKDARVEIVWHKDKAIKHETRTNDKGRFVFMNLGSGNWQIFIEAAGYAQGQKVVNVMQITNNPVVKIMLKKNVEQVIRKELKDDASLIDRANALFAEAKFDEAQEVFEKFLEKQPDFFQTHMFIGNCLKEKGEYDKALAQYRKALEKAPADPGPNDIQVKAKILAAIGDLYIRQNDLKTAQDYFRQSLELNTEDEILAYNVGEIFFSNNKTEEAIRYFKLAASIKPQWPEPYVKLGYTYLNSGDYKSAIESFEKFLEMAPDSDQADTIQEVIKSLKEM